MGRLGVYKVDLKGMTDCQASYEWLVDNNFFAMVDGEGVQKGKVNVQLKITRNTGMYDLQFSLKGSVIVPCDRCLDDMQIEIDTTGAIKAKLGADFADDGDILIVPEQEGRVNVAWYIYEFIVLAIPLKHVHAPGKCDKDMVSKLNRHMSSEVDGEDGGDEMESEDEPSGQDPRWNDLKNLIDIDNE